MTNEVVNKVNTLLHEGFEIDMAKLVPEARLFEDLGLDSLDAVDMLVHMEEKFAVKIQGERMASLRTLKDIYALVGDLQQEGQLQNKL